MALDVLSIATPSYSGGMKATPNGIGLPLVSPLLADWYSGLTDPPSGIGDDVSGGWYGAFVYGNNLFALCRTAEGIGRGVIRYSVNASVDPVTIAYEDFVDRITLGLPSYFGHANCHYFDHVTGDVMLSAYFTSDQTYLLGRWNVSSWPWSAANAVWRCCPSSFGSVVADKIAYNARPYVHVANDRIYAFSQNSGKVLTFKWSDGSYLGEWEWSSSYSASYRAVCIGIYPGTNDVVMGADPVPGGGEEIWRWDASTPTAWVKGDRIFEDASLNNNVVDCVLHGLRTPNDLHGTYGNAMYGLQIPWRDLLGFNSDTLAWLGAINPYSGMSYGIPCIQSYDFNADEYDERIISRFNSSQRCGLGGRGFGSVNFVQIDGAPWILGYSSGSIDHFEGAAKVRDAQGLMCAHAGIGRVDLEWTATAARTPKKLLFEVEKTSVDSEFSAHAGKWRAALDINGGGFTEYRAGSAELGNLDQVVHGKAAWAAWSAGDVITLRVECTSGMLDNFAPVQGNPGDLTTPNLPIANIGPPRDVRVIMDAPADLPDEGKSYGKAGGGRAVNLVPGGGVAEVG